MTMRCGAGLVATMVTAFCVATGAAAETKRPALVGIDHVLFRTTNPEGARRFYGRLLGLAALDAGVVPGIARGAAASGSSTTHMEFLVNRRQRILVEPGLEAGEDERLGHIALATADLGAMAAYLGEKGVKVDGPSKRPDCGAESLRVVDPEGHTIELVQESAVVAAGGPIGPQALSSRLLHAGITVRDPASANAFYRDVLGMSEIWRGGFDTLKPNWVNLRLPESTDYIEYMLRDAPSTRRQLGVDHHACLVVPDIQAAWEQVRERTPPGERAALAPPQIGRNERWQINLYDPDGTRVELMEPSNVR
jgi:lactoylglutathione lyase